MEKTMIEEMGVVLEVKNGKASVLLDKGEACGGCGHCSTSFDGRGMVTRLPASHGVSSGDVVKLEREPVNQVKSGFIIFILPLILLIAGYTGASSILEKAGVAAYQPAGIAIGVFLFSLPYLLLFLKNRRDEKAGKYSMRIVEIVHRNRSTNGTPSQAEIGRA
ncbi:MAG: hypothetical protein DRP87_18320 [Spirochaetes bacterium]|nr:MAG: hypothetical protein DRP87_18320 [Spirochaetota bacterium]